MMVDVVIVIVLIIWSFMCFFLGICVTMWYVNDKAIDEYYEEEIRRCKYD